MPKLSEYLLSLKILRNQLAHNISAKGISAFENERLNTLVPKVLQINGSQNVAKGSWMPLVTVDEFKIDNIKFLPARIAICCDEVLNGEVTSTKEYNIAALINISEINGSKTVYSIKDNSLSGENTVDVEVSIAENNGMYSVLLSFGGTNLNTSVPYKFKSNHTYNWVISAEGWEIE